MQVSLLTPRGPVLTAFGLWLGLVGPSTAARAEQACVTCSDPSAVYLCNIEPGAELLAGTGGQLACLTELAKRGGHEKCSVMRQSDGRCDGLVPINLFPGTGTPTDGAPVIEPQAQQGTPADAGVAPPTTTDAAEPFQAVDEADAVKQADQQAGDKENKGPPKTVVEMADRAYETSKKNIGEAGDAVSDGAKKTGNLVTDTAKKTGEQIGKAGKAVGDAAKKTWQCVTSLFSDC